MKTNLGILLNADIPMLCIWGSDHLLFYNDACLALWPEVDRPAIAQPLKPTASGPWQSVANAVERVLATGEFLQSESAGPISRWAYSPIWHDQGVAGVFATGSGLETRSACAIDLASAADAPDLQDCSQSVASLRQLEADLQVITDTVPVLISLVDKDQRYRFNNRTYEVWFGRPAAETHGKHLREVLGEDAYNVILPHVERVLAGETVSYEDLVNYRSAGTRHIQATYVPQRDAQGQVQGFVALVSDISDRKRGEAERQRAEDALRDSESLKQSILDSTSDCIKLLNKSGQIVFINEGGQITLELHSLEQVLHHSWVDFWQGEDREKAEAVLAAAKAGHYGRMQGYCPTPKGTPKWWDVVATPLKDAAGRVTKVVVISRDITEQKQYEAALQENERSLSTLISNLPGFVYRCRPDWTMEFVSDRVQSITGYAAADFLNDGVAWADLVHPDDLEALTAYATDHTESKTPIRVTYRIIDAQGNLRWIWDRAMPMFSETGELIHWEGFVTDISDRREAEIALQLSEERARLLNSTLSSIIWGTDPKGHFVTPQNEWAAYTGQTRAEYAGLGWLEAIHPDDRQAIQQAWQQAQEKRSTYTAEGRLWHAPTGQYRFFEARGMPLFSADGTVREWIGNITDIDDRRQAELALRESEERFRDLADNISQFAWMANPDGWIFWYNRRWFDYTGTDIEDMQGWGWREVHHPDHVERVVAKLSACIARGETWEDTFPLRSKDGEYRWFLSRAIPLRDEQGRVQRWFGTNTDITELRNTEVALQQATDRLNTALKSAPITLFNQDRDLRYTWIHNPTHELSKDGVLGKGDDELLPTEIATPLIRLKQQVLETGVGVRSEVQVNPLYFDLTVDPIRDEHDAVVGITCAAVDITQRLQLEADRRQAEDTLRQSEDRLRMAVESAQLGTWDWNLVTNELVWDDRCKAMFGISPDVEMTIELFLTGIHPDDRDWVNSAVQDCLDPASERQYNIDYRTVGIEDGVERWIAARGKVYFSASDEPRRFTGIALDISDRKQFEQALVESEAIARTHAEELAVLMETTPAAIWIAHDPQCHTMTANRMAYDLMGTELGSEATATPADGPNQLPFKHCKDGRELLADELPMQKAIQAQQEITDEIEFVFPDGTVRYIYGKVVPLYGPGGKVRGAIGGFADITALKAAEQEREQLLQRERLAREEAERANRIKDDFLAVLSHELRSPLNPILGWSKLLQTHSLSPEKTTKALTTIERNAQLQAQLIDDLLDLARILRGKLHLENAPVSLVPVIEAAIETVKTAAAAKSIGLHLDLETGAQVTGDAARLQQIIWNLLSNAIKFTPDHGQVTVQLTQSSHQAEITIRDTGIGISPDFLPYIFESFRQEDISITRQHGGLGLGLAIVRQLVEAHGGEITADSPGEGQGSVFTVRLPGLRQRSPGDSLEVSAEPSFDLSGLRILAVDDSADARDFLTVLLSQYGAEVTVVDSAIAAIRALKANRPDLIISDIGMPDQDGYRLIRAIRSFAPEKGGQVPAIALTAYASQDDQQQALASGYQRHLSKPLDIERLVRTILELTRR